MPEISFAWRLAAFGAASLLFLALDFLNPRALRNRWREYLFLVGAACMAAGFGAAVDLVTSRISPAYFVIGKGLTSASARHVLPLGLMAGFSAGIVGAALILFFNPRPRDSLKLFFVLWRPFVIAAALGLIAGVAQHSSATLVHPMAEQRLAPEVAARFTTVWAIHFGIYAGALIGIVLTILRVRQGHESTS